MHCFYCIYYSALFILHCLLFIVNTTFSTLNCFLYTVYSVMLTLHCLLFTVWCALFTLPCFRLFKYYVRDAGEESPVDRPILLHSTRIRAVAPMGAYLFHIIILYYFHRGSRTFVVVQARLNPAPVNRIRCNLFSQDNNKGLCSLCGCKTRWLYQRYMLPW